jgi:hypothetical protein
MEKRRQMFCQLITDSIKFFYYQHKNNIISADLMSARTICQPMLIHGIVKVERTVIYDLSHVKGSLIAVKRFLMVF